jgi:2'-hydroxyisoflavone reductase
VRLLVLGGTGFVGRAVVDAARGRHDVTVLNRGHRPAPDGVTALAGDRTSPSGLAALAGRGFDAVVDTWSGAPRAVRDAARALAGRAGHYTYVSSRSVYVHPAPGPLREDRPVVDASPDAGDEADYPAAKRGAELAAEREFGGPVLLARAGLILGPHEDVGRLPWWLRRLARGGATLAPGPRDLPLQYVDARDLAAFLLDGARRGLAGAFNVTGPPGQTTMGELLDTANAVTGGRAVLRWTDPGRILAAGVQPWTDLPIWVPPGPDHDFLHGGDVGRAVGAGLRLRPVADTIADTWSWLTALPGTPEPTSRRPPVGLSAAAEAALLAAGTPGR